MGKALTEPLYCIVFSMCCGVGHKQNWHLTNIIASFCSGYLHVKELNAFILFFWRIEKGKFFFLLWWGVSEFKTKCNVSKITVFLLLRNLHVTVNENSHMVNIWLMRLKLFFMYFHFFFFLFFFSFIWKFKYI